MAVTRPFRISSSNDWMYSCLANLTGGSTTRYSCPSTTCSDRDGWTQPIRTTGRTTARANRNPRLNATMRSGWQTLARLVCLFSDWYFMRSGYRTGVPHKYTFWGQRPGLHSIPR